MIEVDIDTEGPKGNATELRRRDRDAEVVRAIGMIKTLPPDAPQLVIKLCRATDVNRRDSVHDGLRVAPARPSARRSRRGHVR